MNEASNAVTERTDDSPQPKAEMADLRMPTKRAARLLFLLGLYLWVARRSLSPDHCVDLDTK